MVSLREDHFLMFLIHVIYIEYGLVSCIKNSIYTLCQFSLFTKCIEQFSLRHVRIPSDKSGMFLFRCLRLIQSLTNRQDLLIKFCRSVLIIKSVGVDDCIAWPHDPHRRAGLSVCLLISLRICLHLFVRRSLRCLIQICFL